MPQPPSEPPTDEQFWCSNDRNRPNVDFLRDFLAREGRLSHEQALWIIQSAAEVLRKEKTLLRLELPIAICGNIVGQYYDLIKVLDVVGDAADSRYLFLGNYVQKGYFGIEVCSMPVLEVMLM